MNLLFATRAVQIEKNNKIRNRNVKQIIIYKVTVLNLSVHVTQVGVKERTITEHK